MTREVERYGIKDDWLENFASERPDLFFPDSWSEAQKTEAVDMVKPARMKTALFAAIPILCKGPKCPYAEVCPLLAKNLAPVGKSCPIELSIVKEFMVNLIEELNVDPNDLVEVSMVRDLVNQEIQQLRATKILSKEHFIQDAVIGINENTGEPIIKKELHQAVELESRILKNKKDIRNQLLATREAKAKAGQGHLDSAQVLSDIFSQVREIELKKERMLKEQLGTLEKDDYIDGEIISEI